MNDQYEKLMVAKNPETPPETLRSLSKDPDFFVRLLVYDNPNTPAETVESLRIELFEEICSYLKNMIFTGFCLGFFLVCLGITTFKFFYNQSYGF
jgi:hypothetical protein